MRPATDGANKTTSVTLDTWPTLSANMSQDDITHAIHQAGATTTPILWEDDSISCTTPSNQRCLLPRLRALAADPPMQAALVSEMAAVFVQQGHAGVQVDFETHETLTHEDLAAFAGFVHELSLAFHAHRMTVSVVRTESAVGVARALGGDGGSRMLPDRTPLMP
jgi:hypothetical protein